MKNSFFAVHGTITDGKASDVSLQAFRKVKLGSGGSVVGITMQDGAVVWDDASTKGQTTQAKGGPSSFFPQMKFALIMSQREHEKLVNFRTSNYAIVDFAGCQVPKACVTINAEGHLIDDDGRSEQNGVKILDSSSNNGHSDIVAAVKL
ncbi:hypothetical protein CGCTS75_v002134 [Colletotrichum tropicale]|nr:hypothetical protein CGCTS75_v002134 [Colletotrichum tropicale]